MVADKVKVTIDLIFYMDKQYVKNQEMVITFIGSVTFIQLRILSFSFSPTKTVMSEINIIQ